MDSVELTPEVLMAIKNELATAANTILPGLTLDVAVLSCTSASMTIGEDEVARIIKQSDPKREIKEVTNPYTAIKNACAFLDIDELGIITPYSIEVTQGIIDGMEPDIKTMSAFTFNNPNDNLVPSITPESIKDAVIQMAKDEKVKTIFVSCTNLNICRYIDELEKITGKRILTSNQVMAWDILRLAKYKEPIKGFGYLLEKVR
jgi:maleate isomerase